MKPLQVKLTACVEYPCLRYASFAQATCQSPSQTAAPHGENTNTEKQDAILLPSNLCFRSVEGEEIHFGLSASVAACAGEGGALQEWAGQKGLPSDLPSICRNDEARKWVLDQLNMTGKESKLKVGWPLIWDRQLSSPNPPPFPSPFPPSPLPPLLPVPSPSPTPPAHPLFLMPAPHAPSQGCPTSLRARGNTLGCEGRVGGGWGAVGGGV